MPPGSSLHRGSFYCTGFPLRPNEATGQAASCPLWALGLTSTHRQKGKITEGGETEG